MKNKTGPTPVDKTRETENCFSLNGKEIKYKIWYPDKDRDSIYKTLRNEFGYWMVFKSVSWRTEDFLSEMSSELKKNDILTRDHGGFEVKIKILDVK